MDKFVSVGNAMINMRFIRSIRSDLDEKRGSLLTYYDAEGSVLGRDVGSLPEELAGEVVAASVGFFVTILYVTSFNTRPTAEDIYVDRVPVLAWRVVGNTATPILPETVSSNGVCLIECPGGRLMDPENCSYDNLEVAKKTRLQEAQASWDAKRKSVA